MYNVKRILIAGTNSYIGDSFLNYLAQFPDAYVVTELNTVGLNPSPAQFAGFDVVFCVAGIAHIKETRQNRQQYFAINSDLVTDIAKAAKEGGVGQFILLSSMSVYGLTSGHITKETIPHPDNAYSESKLKADEAIRKLEDEHFRFVCLRPPMVYGKGCKGNYQRLRSFALKSPFFPDFHNQRSMVYVENLCVFVKQCIDEEKSGLFFPQNEEYTDTSKMVQLIAQYNGKQIRLTKTVNWLIRIAPNGVMKKVFGSLTYEKTDTVRKYSLEASIELCERDREDMIREGNPSPD